MNSPLKMRDQARQQSHPRIWLLALLAVSLAHCDAAVGQARPDPKGLQHRLDHIFKKWNRPDSPGCAVGLIREGELVFARGYGSANLDYEIPITPDSVFYVGSVSKQFTAAAVRLLAEQGRIHLEDTVRKHFPELPATFGPIRIRHLIHHTSGLPDIYDLMQQNGLPLANLFPDSAALTLIAERAQLQFPPGERFQYSNSGYFLLSQLFPQNGVGSLREFSETNIFKPLGMAHTHFHDTTDHVIKNRAVSYAPRDGGGYRITYLSNFNKVGAGGLYTTLGDLARWDRTFYEPVLGGPRFTARMQERAQLNDGTVLDYASGLQHGQFRGHRTIGHDGSMMGFKASMLRFPDERLTIACLCNLENVEPIRLVEQVAEFMLDDKAPSSATEDRAELQ